MDGKNQRSLCKWGAKSDIFKYIPRVVLLQPVTGQFARNMIGLIM